MAVKKIAVFYGHVASNIGDIAINEGEDRLLRQAFPGAALHFVQLDSEESQYLPLARPSLVGGGNELSFFQASYQKALTYQTRPARFLDDCGVGDADLVVLASGEHLFYYEHGENKKSLFWRTLPALAAKAAGKRCVILPSTFGPFESDGSGELVASLLDIVDDFAARDTLSARLVADRFGIAAPKTLLDPAFFLDPPKVAAGGGAGGEKILGLSMRSEGWGIRLSKERRKKTTDRFTSDHYENSDAFRFSLALCKGYLGQGGRSVRIFVQTVADEALAGHLHTALARAGHGGVVEPYRPVSVDDYLSRIGELDLMVASRFHAVILAMVAEVPAFGAYFDAHGHKMPGLFNLFGMGENCVNLSTTSPEEAAKNALGALPALPATSAAAWERAGQLREETASWLKETKNGKVDSFRLLRALGSVGEFSNILVQEGFKAASNKKVREIAEDNRKLTARDGQMQKKREELEQQLTEVRAQTEARVEQEASRAAAFEQDVKRAEEKCRALERQLAEARAQAEAMSQEASRASAFERDVKRTEEKYRELERQLAEAKKRLLEVERDADHTKKQLQRIKSSILYQSGVETFRAVKQPRKILSLPLTLYSIYRDTNKTRGLVAEMARAKSPAPARTTPSVDLEKDTAALLAKSPDEIIKQIRGAQASTKDAAWKLAQLSKVFSDRGQMAEGCELAQAACELAPSEGTYRASFWALQKAGRLEEACDAIDALEAFMGSDTTSKQKERLHKLKSQSYYQIGLRDLIVPKGERQIPVVPGRICYVLHNSLPYSSGGYATRGQGLAKGLRSLGFDVVVVTRPGFPIDIKSELNPQAVPLTDTVDGIRHIRSLAPMRKTHAVEDFVPAAADVLEAHFRELQPEIVMAASNHVCALPALIAARRLGLNFIYEVRGFWEITRLSRQPGFSQHALYRIQEALETLVCKHADKVLTLTEAMKDELVRRGVPEEKIGIAPNSCEPELFSPRDRDAKLAAKLGIPANIPVIGYVGTFVDYEGLDDLAQACALLKRKGIEFRLLLVGNENASGSGHGTIAESIQTIAAEAGFTDWLIMPGRVPHDEVASYYSLIDIAPFPRKPWPVCEMVSPMKPLEALAMEKAVVVSSVAALSEMIDDRVNGLVFEKGDIAALAEILEEAIASPDLRGKLGKQGRNHVLTQRTWKQTAGVVSEAMKEMA